MAAAHLQHPAPEELASFIRGQLAPEEQAVVEQHVAECPSCADYLTVVDDDTLMERLRAGATPPLDNLEAPEIDGPRDAADLPDELRQHSRYRIVRPLGAGGMGVVYLAEHRFMERTVALKVINRRLTRNQMAVERFRQEVRGAAKLSHPNIVAAHDAEQAGDVHFLVMEFVDGVSLAQLVARRGPLPLAHACNYIKQAAQGLQHAWQNGLVHRDIKPANLMLTRAGRVKILDFGLARLAQEQASEGALLDTEQPADLTASGTTIGTPDYIAPEQISDSHTVGIEADIYSLGATFYFLLIGKPPFADGRAADKLIAHRCQAPRSVAELRPDVPPEVAAIVARMLAKNPSERFATPADVAAALAPWSKAGVAAPSSVSAATLEPPPSLEPPIIEAPVIEAPMLETTNHSTPIVTGRAGTRSKIGRSRRPDTVKIVSWGVAAVFMAAATAIGMRAFFTVEKPTRRDSPLPTSAPADAGSNRSAMSDESVPVEQPRASRPVAPPIAAASKNPRVLLVIPHQYLWYPDYDQVARAFKDRNETKVTVASSSLDLAQPSRISPGAQPIQPDVRLQDVDPSDFDIVIFTGAYPARGMEYLAGGKEHAAAARVVDGVLKHGGQATAICAGTAVLADLGVLKGRSAAENQYALQAVQSGHGATWINTEAVVTDGPIVTARDAQAARLFVQTLLAPARSAR